MCGRYGRFSRKERIEQLLGHQIQGGEELGLRYNICPTTEDWVLKQSGGPGDLVLERHEWGLLPPRAKTKTAVRQINARAETVAEKIMFRDLLRHRRCAVPADGYYEWRTTSSGKVPFWFTLKSRQPFFFAGLWDVWHEGHPDATPTFLLMTTEPNELAATVHDRMPVILHANDVKAWLDPAITEPRDLAHLLGPYPAEEMGSHAVTRAVSNPKNEGPGLIRPDDSVRELWG